MTAQTFFDDYDAQQAWIEQQGDNAFNAIAALFDMSRDEALNLCDGFDCELQLIEELPLL